MAIRIRSRASRTWTIDAQAESLAPLFEACRGEECSISISSNEGGFLRSTPRSAYGDAQDLADRIARAFGPGRYLLKLKLRRNGVEQYAAQRSFTVPSQPDGTMIVERRIETAAGLVVIWRDGNDVQVLTTPAGAATGRASARFPLWAYLALSAENRP